MRGMEQNKQSFWYALYERSEPILDADGNEVGERSVYGKPVKENGNISAARGSTENDLFGVNAVYTKTINPMLNNCPIDESSILWIDVSPEIEADGRTVTAHDYVVSQVARSLNHKAYAISRVDVTVGDGH
jgi:hypothetical protein